MNPSQIQEKVANLAPSPDFIYSLLTAYGLPKASISRLKKGDYNLSKHEGDVVWKKRVYFRELETNLREELDIMLRDEVVTRYKLRFIIVTDYERLLAVDTQTDEKLDIALSELSQHYTFFLPWAGMEKTQHQNENPADVKAAERMARLYEEICKANPELDDEGIHSLNVFLSRLLFCYFAEDTGIFDEGIFTNGVGSHTCEDGSDLGDYLETLFEVLDTSERGGYPSQYSAFPYVNGKLFRTKLKLPEFNRKTRRMMIDAGKLNWKDINPDIFGSMIQAVVTQEHRSGLGMHYTSVPNIMKVIGPLFLDDLYEEFVKAKDSAPKLLKLISRLSDLKIFDPACGSGNFLIIAYKRLRTLEIAVLKQLDKISPQEMKLVLSSSIIELDQFYGIELDDFAHEIARLSLWLAEHQMNAVFEQELGKAKTILPLEESGNIVHGNATRLDWEEVCPKEGAEVYVLGNPPYVGGKSQSKEQKEDLALAFKGKRNFKELDYIACWFLKGSNYLSTSESCYCAFVSTSSICEGAQVEQLWPVVSNLDVEIFFAYKPFNWTNNARDKAGVTCTIIGMRKKSEGKKTLYDESLSYEATHINGYLANAEEVYVTKRQKPFSNLPTMITGNSPYEGGNLMLTPSEKAVLVNDFPKAQKLIRRAYGANECINGKERYCLWIEDTDLEHALQIPPIKKRIENIRNIRLNGGSVARGIADRPHQFRYTHTGKTSIIVMPIVSSSRREYIPIGLVPKDAIVLSSAAAIYDTEPFVFGVVSSKIHMLWVRMTAGKLRGDIRYLSALSYNTFPIPTLTKQQKENISTKVFGVLEQREKHPEKTLADLYDPDKMPDGLRQAHRELDLAVEKCYRSKPFVSDEERLEYLFKLYERMIAAEQGEVSEQGELYA